MKDSFKTNSAIGIVFVLLCSIIIGVAYMQDKDNNTRNTVSLIPISDNKVNINDNSFQTIIHDSCYFIVYNNIRGCAVLHHPNCRNHIKTKNGRN